MVLNIQDLFQGMIDKEVKTAHLEKKITTKVVAVDKLNKKMKDAITKAMGAKFLKDCDYIIGCVESESEPVAEPENDQKEDSEKPAEDTTGAEEKNDQEADKKDTAEKKDDEKKEEEVNEAVKVQDLTSSMLSVPKAKKCGCGCKTEKKSCKCVKEEEKEEKKEDKKDEEKETAEDNKTEDKPVEEAETEATGDELRGKFSKALERIFKNQLSDSNKIELFDVKDFVEGANIYFAKITLKDNGSSENDSNPVSVS